MGGVEGARLHWHPAAGQGPHAKCLPAPPPCSGVLNVVHGSRGVVNAILDHPDIRAVSFVSGH
jgi:hypothetical protein